MFCFVCVCVFWWMFVIRRWLDGVKTGFLWWPVAKAMAMLDAFNLYFFCVIRARSKLPAHAFPAVEGRQLSQLSSFA